MLKWFAAGIAIATALAGATAYSRSAPEASKKADRLDIVGLTCPQIEWPYGCLWDSPKSWRTERPVSDARKHRSFRSRLATAKARRIALVRATANQTTTR